MLKLLQRAKIIIISIPLKGANNKIKEIKAETEVDSVYKTKRKTENTVNQAYRKVIWNVG